MVLKPMIERAKQPCPKCNRMLTQDGEVSLDGGTPLPTFQCDECMMKVRFAGSEMEVALTFVRLPDGTICDPADPEGEIRF